MAWGDVAVSGGGSTCWELAFMGLPNLALALADNQRGIADGLGRAGVAENLGWFEEVNEETIATRLEDLLKDRARRAEMGRRGRKLVDGRGPERVVDTLSQWPGAS
jgi:spore coat polysaccharide biosynthesis predicted glycosyltransferase SpsG